MTNPEKTVEDELFEAGILFEDENQCVQLKNVPVTVLRFIQAERQRCEEMVEAVMPWVEHDNQCILQRNERGEPTEGGGYRTMYAGVWYKSGEEPDCDCGLKEAVTKYKITL